MLIKEKEVFNQLHKIIEVIDKYQNGLTIRQLQLFCLVASSNN
jgi:hypothetical protein